MPDTTDSLGGKPRLADPLSGEIAWDDPNAVPVPGFELLEELGRGGMGIVWKAKDLRLGREVAVKILQDRYNIDSPICERFYEESKITAQLQHPGVPAIYEMGTREDRRPYLAMKLIKGRTLDDLLRHDPKLDKLAVFEAIAQTVGYAHEHWVVHRDLKPSNVMVGNFGEVQVMDWGLAKMVGSVSRVPSSNGETLPATFIISGRDSTNNSTRAGSLLGTPAFMSPEQASGQVQLVDARSDVFGLGGILCVMLTGKPPYIGSDDEKTREKAEAVRLEDAMQRLDTCGGLPALVALCRECLSKDKADRPINGKAVAQRVAEIRLELEEAAKTEAASRVKRRAYRTAAVLLTATLLAGMIGTTIGLVNARAARDAEAEARQIADLRRAEAERNLETAYGLAKSLARSSERILASVPDNDRTRIRLIDAAHRAMEQVRLLEPDNAEIQLEAIKIQRFWANQKRLYGSATDAVPALEEAYERAAKWKNSETLQIEILIDLAAAEELLGWHDSARSRLDIASDLAQATPSQLTAVVEARLLMRLELAWAEWYLADLQAAKAHEHARLARAQFDRTLQGAEFRDQQPYDPLLAAMSLNMQIRALRELKRLPETRELIEQAAAEFRTLESARFSRLGADDFNFTEAAFKLNHLRCEYDLAQKSDFFVKQYHECLRVADNLIIRHPGIPAYRYLRIACHRELIEYLVASGMAKNAETACEMAMIHCEEDTNWILASPFAMVDTAMICHLSAKVLKPVRGGGVAPIEEKARNFLARATQMAPDHPMIRKERDAFKP